MSLDAQRPEDLRDPPFDCRAAHGSQLSDVLIVVAQRHEPERFHLLISERSHRAVAVLVMADG